MTVETLPENFVLASIDDFRIDGGLFNVGMSFAIQSVLTPQIHYEVYTITSSWNTSQKGREKLIELLPFIEANKCWVNKGKKVDDVEVLPTAPDKPKPKKVEKNDNTIQIDLELLEF